MSYQEIIRLISNGDPVDSSINNIFRQVAGNVDYIKARLEAALLGAATIASEVTVESSVKVGQPVYYDAANQRFAQALASAYVDNETEELVTADSTQVWGICYVKHNSTSADIVLSGYVSVDMTEAITGTEAGLYYLSGTTAGKLVKQKPPVTVTVLYWDGVSKVYVNPTFDDAFLKHQHYKFSLQPVPAGQVVVPPEGATHSIIAENTDIEGWLRADSPAFSSTAPAGAKFGYNIAKSALNNLWPPLPVNSCSISIVRPTVVDRGSVTMPGNLQHSETFAETRTVTAGDTVTVTKSLTASPSVTTGVVTISESIYNSVGLIVKDVTLSATDTVTFKLVNDTDADIDVTDTLTVTVYDEQTVAVPDAIDYTEDAVPDELVTIDHNGIWWMTDAYGLVPWPVNYNETPATVSTARAIVNAGKYSVGRRTAAGGSDAAVFYGENAYQTNDVDLDSTNYFAFVSSASLGKVIRLNVNEPQADYLELWSGTGSNPYGVSFVSSSNTVYFTDTVGGKIHKVGHDGSGHTELVTGLTSPKGIHVDTVNSYIYFIDDTKIRRCTLTGGSVTDIVTGLNAPKHLFVDAANSYIYWTDTGTAKLQRSTLVGASITDIVTGATDIIGLTADITNSYLYFTAGDYLIRRCSLTGTGLTTIETLSTQEVLGGLAVASLPTFGTNINADLSMALTLWFTKMQFQSSSTVVTSLKAAADSGLTIRCTNDDTITTPTGDLEIDLDLNLLVDTATTEEGYYAFKRFENKKFYKGPVVEGIIVDSDFINVSSTHQVGSLHQGRVTLSYTPTPVGSELPIEMVRLNNVTEENYQDVLGLGFPEGVDAEYRAKVNIPSTIEATTISVKLRLSLLTRVSGDLPAFTLTSRSLARPGTTSATSVSLPTTDSSVVLSVAAATGMAQDYYVEIESAAMTVTPGGFLLFTLTRNGSSDSFAGDIHVIDQRAVISAVS